MRKKKEISLALKCTKCKVEENEYPLDILPASFRKSILKTGVQSQYCYRCNCNTLHQVVGIIITEQRPLTERQVKNLLQKKEK